MDTYTPILDEDAVEALLGRPLSSVEADNFETYLEITEMKLKDMLCLEKWPDEMPIDLKMLIAKYFGTIQAEQNYSRDDGVTSKRVEDFSINFSTNRKNPMALFLESEAATIAKYSKCSLGIKHGKTIYDDCIRCF